MCIQIVEGMINESLPSIKDTIRQTINETIVVYKNETEERLNLIDEKIQKNKENIAINEENVSSVQNQSDINEERIGEVEQSMNNQSDIREYIKLQNEFNWISGVSNKPKEIDDGFVDDRNEKKNDGGGNLFGQVFEFFENGTRRMHEKLAGSNKWTYDEHKNLANKNLAGPEGPSQLNPGDCVAFLSQDNWIEFRLSQKIKPTNFEYNHIDKTRIDKKDKNKSPKRFKLFGKLENNDDDWIEIDIENDDENIMEIDDSSIRLQLVPQNEFKFIRVEYETNENAEITRLYRFRIDRDMERIKKHCQNIEENNDDCLK